MKYFFAFIVALFSLLAAAAPAPAPAPAAQDIQVAPKDMEARHFFAITHAPAPAPAAQEIQVAPEEMARHFFATTHAPAPAPAAQEIQAAPKGMEAAPAPAPAAQEIQAAPEDMGAQQFFANTRNELVTGAGPCPPAIFIFARGSMEQGNMGAAVGPPLASALKSRLGQSGVWIQGVGGPYGATLADNAWPDGSNEAAIQEMRRLFTLASTKCPKARIIAGGYSQGAALATAAISRLDESTRAKIAGTVLFGYPKNLQYHGQIPNYQPDRLKVYCNPGDAVCTGSPFITAAHLDYAPAATQDAPQFLVSRLQKTQLVA